MKILPDRLNPLARLLDRFGCTDGEKKYLFMGIQNVSGSALLLYLCRSDPISLSIACAAIALINYKWLKLVRKREECLNCGRIKLPSEMSGERDEFGCVVCKRCCARVETRKRIRDQRTSRPVHERTAIHNWKAHPSPPPPVPAEEFPARPRFSWGRKKRPGPQA